MREKLGHRTQGARSRGGAAGSTGRGGVRASEAGGGGEGYSSSSDAGGWQTRGARTVQIGAEGEWRGWQTTTVVVEEAGAGGRAGIFEERALEGTFEERALENREPPQGWTREPETKEGWTGPAGTTERGEGAVQSPDQSPSLSDPPPNPAAPDV